MIKIILTSIMLAFMTLGAVEADVAQPVMIHTNIVFLPDAIGTFTATPPLCASGTFIDAGFVSNPSQLTGHGFMGIKEFTCDDDSGTFNIRFHPLAQGWHDPEFLLTGPWSVANGSTGSYVNLTGHGDFGVVIDFEQDPWIGEETLVGSVKLR